ncbi:MAG: hypothetical protein LUE08_04340, partial [Akkermansiaceae bacterium]|nr:hypothetical protein [Akkermansiaceae bacterium]
MTEDTHPSVPEPGKAPAPKLSTPAPPARKVLLSTGGAVPRNRVRLLSSAGKPLPARKPAPAAGPA